MISKKNNITLIGMPGSGKSTIGVVLAKVLGYQFTDSDLLIQEKEGKLLCEIIKEKGNQGFQEIENEVNGSIMTSNSVIATGGSAVYGDKAMEHLREISTVVYLRLSYEEIESRLGDLKDRGVVLKENQTLLDLYKERTPLYEKYAHIIVDAEGLTIKELQEKIRIQLEN